MVNHRPSQFGNQILRKCSTLLLFASAVACAQTGNVVISANTSWPTGAYVLTSLTVQSGATLTVGGGSTVNVSGAVLVTASSNIVLQSVNTMAQVSGAWAGAGSTVKAGSVQVDAGSSINADGQGYAAQAGPGAAGGYTYNGGSYGGLGGGQPGATVYGAPAAPTDLGSGGGTYQSPGGSGGGAVRLIVSGALTDNGVISANGGNANGFGGGGSGGSIYVTAGALSGAGTLLAEGGGNASGYGNGGGGGRIAVYFNTATGFSGFPASLTIGGTVGNGAAAGTVGTVAFFDTSSPNTGLLLYQNFSLGTGSIVTYDSVTVQNGATLTVGGGSSVTVTGSTTLTGTSRIVLSGANTTSEVNNTWAGNGPAFNSGSVLVDAGSSINADAQGYVAHTGPGAAGAYTTDGGSYGGIGGGQPASTVYGSDSAPLDLGSGGGSYGAPGGAGGGAVRLSVSGTLTLNGVISANGGDANNFAGGGAGGSVYVTTGALDGSGTFTANGGGNPSGYGKGGGGGRVAVSFNTAPAFTGFNSSSAAGGITPSNGTPGSLGTVVFIDTSVTNSNLDVYENFNIPAGTTATYNSITVRNGALFTVAGGSAITVTGAVLVTGNSTLLLQSINNTAQVNGAWAGSGSTLTAGSLQVDPGSSVNADGQGYVGQAGPGAGVSGTVNGGSYGGIGGGQAASTIYGSAPLPVSLGSGGGAYGAVPGAGGGVVQLTVSGALTNNGVISANGAAANGFAGGGSGGSVLVTTGTLSGSGIFSAAGGPNTSLYGNSGGGGRVAIYYNSQVGFTGFGLATAAAGTLAAGSNDTAGSVGTSAFFDTSVANNTVGIYQNYVIPPSASVQYNSLTVNAGATLVVAGASTLSVTQAMHVAGTVLAQSINTTAPVNGLWQGQGVIINAGSLLVDAGGTINADSQGYVPQAGPGAGPAGQRLGGSYGGSGGEQPNTSTYGSSTAPVSLGSGGSQDGGQSSPGGGAIQLNVSGTLTNNGMISANAAQVSGFVGGSSGGSVYVTTATLAGMGSFTANGGSNITPYGDGGGGGRVAVYSANSAGFSGFTASTATGGSAVPNGIAGSNGSAAFFDTSVANNNVSIFQNYVLPANSTSTFNSLTVGSGANLTVGGGQLIVMGNLHVTGTVVMQSTDNSTPINGTYQGRGARIVAGAMLIDPAGSLVADGLGYGVQSGPGAGAGGTSNGGSYGGAGGGNGSAPAYGSANNPLDLGSGGGQYQGNAGAGGGAIQVLVSGTLTDNGRISANGIDVNGFVGGGSGGSINLAANAIAGTGTIAANGGANATPYGAGGGGGRIAVSYLTNSGFNPALATASGGAVTAGSNANAAGSGGTVEFLNAPASAWITPTASVIHGSTTLEWFSDAGGLTSVSLVGPQTAVIANGSGSLSSAAFDTTMYPDGAYQLVLFVYNNAGQLVQQVNKSVVINNSVQWHSGILTTSQTWGPTPVQALDADVIVPFGVTLTILPGTTVKVLPGVQILVQSGGTLIANGTSTAQVIFTTFDDYTTGGNTDFNQGSSLPEPGEWNGIGVLSGGTFASNQNTIVQYTQTALSGTLGPSTTLFATQVYVVSGNLIVPSGVTLNIQPGTVIKFSGDAGITFQSGSTLVANGTLAQPIYFTSINDSSIGGDTARTGGSVAPMPGDWNSIILDGTSASFQHVQIQYGGGPVTTNAQTGMIETTDNANVTISDSVLASSFFIGIQTAYPNGGGDTVTVTDSAFYGIEDRAINAFGPSVVHVVNDTFDGNAYGVLAHGGTVDVSNSVFSNSVGTQFGTMEVCCGGSFSSFVNNDVFTTAKGVINYVGYNDPTGTNGNLSVNPVYMSAPVHDYRPTYGSPLIDAGDGTVPNYPATDFYGIARYSSPLVMNKTGKPDATGKYPDIGAFEFVQTAPSNLDLTVSNVQGPTSATVGAQATLTWTVTNIGSGTVYGPWHDGVYLVSDPGTNGQEVLAGQVLEGQGVTLGPGASYSATGTVTVPGITVGTHRWEIKTNDRGEIFEGANTANNTAVALGLVSTDMPELVTGAAALTGTFSAAGQTSFYKVVASPTQAINVQLGASPTAGTAVQLFVGADYVPTPQQFDFQSSQFNASTASVAIPTGVAQTYYIAANSQQLATAPATFSIQATAVQFSLTNVSPGIATNGGAATLTFTGGGFTSTTSFTLVDASGKSYPSTSVYLADSEHADVTFDLTKVAIPPAGSATLSATAANGSTVTLGNALTVSTANASVNSANGSAVVRAWFDTPEAFRPGFPALVTLNYQNTGGADIPAPMIYVSATNGTLTEIAPLCATCSVTEAQQVGATFNSGLVLGINQLPPAGVLPAGGSGNIQFLATPTSNGSITFYVSSTAGTIAEVQFQAQLAICVEGACPPPPPIPVNLGTYPSGVDFCNSLVPAGSSAQGFTRACMLLLNRAGFVYEGDPYLGTGSFNPTPGGLLRGYLPFANFNQLLATDATELSAQGDYEYDVQKLLAYELDKDGQKQFNQRYHAGAFGYGSSTAFDITLNASPTPTVTFPDGSARTFPAVSPTNSNIYLGMPGDYGTLTLNPDNSYTLTETDGTLYHFPPAQGGIDSIQDRNGNKLTLSYAQQPNGYVALSTITDSLGHTTTFQYDNNAHVKQITDALGRVSTYTYDLVPNSQNAFLRSVTNAQGTTTINWNEGGPSGVGYTDDSCVATYCEPAIGVTGIARPDGTQTFYTYDAAGRVASTYGNLNSGLVRYTYNSDGSVTTTDALNGTFTVKSNVSGGLVEQQDALGNVIQFRYDAENKLTGIVNGLGQETRLGFDGRGNANSVQTPSGGLTSYAFTGDDVLSSLTDAAGFLYTYNYDKTDNLSSVADPAGRTIQYTYDANGHMLTRTNRRGQTTTYSYTPSGLLASSALSTGATTTFTYDVHNNLQTSTTAAGTVSYSYDAADDLTGIANPDGTSLTYTYNSGGQLTNIRDSPGFSTNYAYDAAGRLSALTDNSGNKIVTYTYDAANHLTAKAFGNGASTTYGYDAAGHKTSVTHRSASNAILAEYDYTYDANDQPVTEKAPDGLYTLSYDADGELTGVNAAASSVLYAYDPDGNRTSVTSNGALTPYLPNDLNEYTAVGAVPYTYDADGNVLSANGYVYTYDENSRMLTASNATNSWSFTYDPVGLRTSATYNGVTTRYLNDPSGYGNVEATLTATGTPLAHFTHGVDLTSDVPAGGLPNYFHFDATGNTVQVTGPTGGIVNSYAYQSYGEKSVIAAGIPNPFTYSGKNGALDDGMGLYQMRQRWYNPAIGRFQQQDSTGLAADTNSYRYALNSPAAYIDPDGTDAVGTVTDSCASHVFNAATALVPASYVGASLTVGGLGATGSGIGFANDLDHKDYLSALHDGGLAALYAVGAAAQAVPPTPASKALALLGRFAGVIDESSQLYFNNYFMYKYTGHGASIPCIPDPKPAPPPNPNGKKLFGPGSGKTKPVKGSSDPNGKITSGDGDQGFTPAGAPILYTVFFENQPTATAAAQKVTVTDSLPSNLDWSSLQLQQIMFNNVSLSLPSNVQSYNAQANVSTDLNPVSVAAALNPANGTLTLTMQSVDAITGSAPANPLAGFLPPNTASNQGVGSITFSVLPKSGLPNGTVIANQASIVFDANAAIGTNTVTNVLDLTAPTSSVSPLPASTSNASFGVSWNGSDPSGSGIAYYNIYVEVDGGPASLWLSATTATSSTYTAAASGHSYTFYSLAVNNVGTPQPAPVSPQIITVTTSAPTVMVTPASGTVTFGQTLQVSVAVVGVAGSSVPTGSVALTIATYSPPAVTLSGGAATFVVPASALTPGSDTLSVTYTPDALSAPYYGSATGMAFVTATPVASPGASLTPAALSFTSNLNVTSPAQTLTLTNSGTAALAITGIAVTGAGASNFAQSNNCGNSLLPMATCSISVSFTPSSVSSFSASLSVSDNATGSPQTASLTGTGSPRPAPVASLTPSSLSFSSPSGTASSVQTINLSNTGNAPLLISGVSIAGSGAGTFAQSNTCGMSLAAGASCMLSVIFTPSSVATFTAALSIADNANGSPQMVSLTGSGTTAPAPVATLTPGTLMFSSVNGVASATQTAQLSNTGSAALVIGSITVNGTGAATFAETNTCSGSLAVASSCTISVTFTPNAVATFNASLSVADNAAGSPQTVALLGTGSPAPAPVVSLTPATLSFTSVSGIESAAQTVQLTNSGNAPLLISGIGVTGAGASTFAQANTCGVALAAAGTCTISITFTPNAVGNFAATLSLTDNAAGSPQTLTLSGTGVAPPTFTLSATPASQTVTAGSVATYSIALTSQGGAFTNPITLAATGLPPGATAAFLPSTVTPGSSGATSVLTIQTSTTKAELRPPTRWPLAPLFAMLGFFFIAGRTRRRLTTSLLALALAFATVIAPLAGCGGSANAPTPSPTTYTITITGTTSSTTSQTTTVTLTVQ